MSDCDGQAQVEIITVDSTVECGGTQVTVIDQAAEIIDCGVQGPAGAPGGTTQVTYGGLTPSTTAVIDVVDGTLYRSMKWIVNLKDTAGDRYTAFEILAIHDGTDVEWVEYSIINAGALLLHTVDVQYNANNMELRITNDDTINFDIRALKLMIEVG